MSLGRMSHAIFGVASALGSSLHDWPFGALSNYMLRSFVGILNILVTTGFLPFAICILSLNLNWSTVYFPAGITRGLEVGNACSQHGPRHVTLDPLTCGLLRLSAVQPWAAAVMKSHAQTCKVLSHVSNYGDNLILNISSPERQQLMLTASSAPYHERKCEWLSVDSTRQTSYGTDSHSCVESLGRLACIQARRLQIVRLCLRTGAKQLVFTSVCNQCVPQRMQWFAGAQERKAGSRTLWVQWRYPLRKCRKPSGELSLSQCVTFLSWMTYLLEKPSSVFAWQHAGFVILLDTRRHLCALAVSYGNVWMAGRVPLPHSPNVISCAASLGDRPVAFRCPLWLCVSRRPDHAHPWW